MEKIRFYVLNDQLKLEKKIYHIFDWTLPQPVAIKPAIYFIIAMAVLFGLPFVPLLGLTVSWIPWFLKFALAFGVARFLSGTATEERSPFSFFRSAIEYHFKTPANVTYYKGRQVVTPPPVKFRGGPTIANPTYEKKETPPDIIKIKPNYTIGADVHGNQHINGLPGKAHRKELGVG